MLREQLKSCSKTKFEVYNVFSSKLEHFKNDIVSANTLNIPLPYSANDMTVRFYC